LGCREKKKKKLKETTLAKRSGFSWRIYPGRWSKAAHAGNRADSLSKVVVPIPALADWGKDYFFKEKATLPGVSQEVVLNIRMGEV